MTKKQKHSNYTISKSFKKKRYGKKILDNEDFRENLLKVIKIFDNNIKTSISQKKDNVVVECEYYYKTPLSNSKKKGSTLNVFFITKNGKLTKIKGKFSAHKIKKAYPHKEVSFDDDLEKLFSIFKENLWDKRVFDVVVEKILNSNIIKNMDDDIKDDTMIEIFDAILDNAPFYIDTKYKLESFLSGLDKTYKIGYKNLLGGKKIIYYINNKLVVAKSLNINR